MVTSRRTEEKKKNNTFVLGPYGASAVTDACMIFGNATDFDLITYLFFFFGRIRSRRHRSGIVNLVGAIRVGFHVCFNYHESADYRPPPDKTPS